MIEESGESGGENEAQDMDQTKFLKSLVSHYESLVQDISRELMSCRNDMKNYIEQADINGSEKHITELDDFRVELSRKDKMIEFLSEQLRVGRKSKDVLKNLWESTVNQIEELEIQKASKGPAGIGTASLAPNFLMKWKLLQAYACSLETKIAKSTNENEFYRSKILEIRSEHESNVKKLAAEKAQEIQQVKASYTNEIEYLRSSLEKLGNVYEKRLKAQQENWELEENRKLMSIKLNVERLVASNKALVIRETELKGLIIKLESDFRSAKSHLQKFYSTTPTQCTPVTNTTPHTECETKMFKLIQTDFEYIHPDQFQSLKTSQKQLETEYRQIVAKLQVSQNDSLDKRNRLQSRIQQLESLNAKLQSRIIDLECVNNSLKKCSKVQNHDDDYQPMKAITVPTKSFPPQTTYPSWKEHFEPSTERVFCQKDMKIKNLDQEILRLHHDRNKLIEIIEKQRNIASKWKAEFKELAKRSIS